MEPTLEVRLQSLRDHEAALYGADKTPEERWALAMEAGQKAFAEMEAEWADEDGADEQKGLKYDPNQPRRPDGEWGGGGADVPSVGGGSSPMGRPAGHGTGHDSLHPVSVEGGGGGGDDSGKRGMNIDTDFVSARPQHTPLRPGMGDAIETRISDVHLMRAGSAAGELDEAGHFSPARIAMHDAIINQLLSHDEAGQELKRQEHPEFMMMGGGPASGKSTMVKNKSVTLPTNRADVNPDDIMKMMPGVKEAIAAGDKNYSHKYYNEALHIAERTVAAAMERHHNVSMDASGDTDPNLVRQRIAHGRENGFTVNATYAAITPGEAIDRVQKRGDAVLGHDGKPNPDFGRYIPESAVAGTYIKVAKVLPQVIEDFDNVKLFDTTVFGKPVLISEAHGKGTLKIHDQERWDNFTALGVLNKNPWYRTHYPQGHGGVHGPFEKSLMGGDEIDTDTANNLLAAVLLGVGKDVICQTASERELWDHFDAEVKQMRTDHPDCIISLPNEWRMQTDAKMTST